MLTSYSRVTVVSGSRRVDLALPSALPVADVVPQVMRFCAPDVSAAEPTEFTLGRVGGQSLNLSQSLAEAGVHDGDVLELRTFSEQNRAAFIEDVRDAVEDSVDGAGGAWTSRSTATFAIVATCGVLALPLVASLLKLWMSVLDGPVGLVADTATTASAAIAAVAVVAMTWAATIWAAPWTAYVTTTVAGLEAFVAGVEVVSRQHGGATLVLTVGAAAAAGVGGLTRLLTARALPFLAASLVVLAAAATVFALHGLQAQVGIVVRVVAVLAVLSIGAMPRLSIAVGGLSSADYRVRNAGRMSDTALSARFQESSGLLLGAVIGVAVVVGLIGFWLGLRNEDWSQDVWDRILSLTLAATLLLRSRAFSRVQYMVPLRVAAIVVALATVQQLADENPGLADWLVALVAAAGVVAVALSLLDLSDVTRARIKRLLNVVEFVVIVDLVVVTMGAVTLYDYIRND